MLGGYEPVFEGVRSFLTVDGEDEAIDGYEPTFRV